LSDDVSITYTAVVIEPKTAPATPAMKKEEAGSIHAGDATIVEKPGMILAGLQAISVKDQEEEVITTLDLSERTSLSIGRTSDNDLVLTHPTISRAHARIDRLVAS
jgi:pSer/pThr/pTyr-binding forkhead associated (FHA) protein